MTSDCLGDARGAAPNLSRSYRGIDVCIISTAQHARPNVIQCNEPVLAQLIKFSLEVVIKPFSVEEITQKLYLIANQDDLREGLSSKSLRRGKLFDWNKSAEQCFDIILNVVK